MHLLPSRILPCEYSNRPKCAVLVHSVYWRFPRHVANRMDLGRDHQGCTINEENEEVEGIGSRLPISQLQFQGHLRDICPYLAQRMSDRVVDGRFASLCLPG